MRDFNLKSINEQFEKSKKISMFCALFRSSNIRGQAKRFVGKWGIASYDVHAISPKVYIIPDKIL